MNLYNNPYQYKLQVAKNIGIDILEKNKNVPNKTVIFDFDDTLGYSYFINNENYLCPAITYIVELAKHANKLGYKVYIITARSEIMKDITYNNVELFGIKIENVFTSLDNYNDIMFKYKMRNNLQKVNNKTAKKMSSHDLYHININVKQRDNLNIILTVGDQYGDIYNCSNYGIKLPMYDPNHNQNELSLFEQNNKIYTL